MRRRPGQVLGDARPAVRRAAEARGRRPQGEGDAPRARRREVRRVPRLRASRRDGAGGPAGTAPPPASPARRRSSSTAASSSGAVPFENMAELIDDEIRRASQRRLIAATATATKRRGDSRCRRSSSPAAAGRASGRRRAAAVPSSCCRWSASAGCCARPSTGCRRWWRPADVWVCTTRDARRGGAARAARGRRPSRSCSSRWGATPRRRSAGPGAACRAASDPTWWSSLPADHWIGDEDSFRATLAAAVAAAAERRSDRARRAAALGGDRLRLPRGRGSPSRRC